MGELQRAVMHSNYARIRWLLSDQRRQIMYSATDWANSGICHSDTDRTCRVGRVHLLDRAAYDHETE